MSEDGSGKSSSFNPHDDGLHKPLSQLTTQKTDTRLFSTRKVTEDEYKAYKLERDKLDERVRMLQVMI